MASVRSKVSGQMSRLFQDVEYRTTFHAIKNLNRRYTFDEIYKRIPFLRLLESTIPTNLDITKRDNCRRNV